MLTTDRSRRGLRGPVAATVVAAAFLMLPGQATLATEPTSPELDSAGNGSSLELEGATVTQLRDQVISLNALNTVLTDENLMLTGANGTLMSDNSSLSQAIDEMTRERDRLRASLTHLDDLYDPLEADRQLLVELRKGLPETRGEVEAQLVRIQRLALSSNAARLGQLVDRVSDTAPAFLDWRFTQFETTQEASEAYVNSGANAFDTSMDDFRSAVLLSVANRLDGLLNVVDRTR